MNVDSKGAVWSIFSHATGSSIAKDPRLPAKRAKQMLLPLPLRCQSELSELARILGLWLIFMGPPEHTRLRKLLNKDFPFVAVEGLALQVEAIVDQTLTPLQPGSEVELMLEFANPLSGAHYSGNAGNPARTAGHIRPYGRGPSRCSKAIPIARWTRHARRKMHRLS